MFCISVRRIRNGAFDDEPPEEPNRFTWLSHYLDVPDNATPAPAHKISRTEWVRRVMATFGPGPDGNGTAGDLTFFVHGYNTSVAGAARRQRQLHAGLKNAGFATTVISFDWPSGTTPIGYLEDRHDARITAMRLVTDGIKLLTKARRPDCRVNVHVVAHSMGAFVVREAFDDADNSSVAEANWTANQVVLVAGDVSAASLKEGNSTSDGLYRHAARLTNYYNRHDSVLQISNVKRVGLSPRVGRVGLPTSAPGKGVDVDCSDRFEETHSDGPPDAGDINTSHSFYFTDSMFYKDLAATLLGRADRAVFPTRAPLTGGGPFSFMLKPG